MATPRGAQHRDLEQRLRDMDQRVKALTNRVLRRPKLQVTSGDFSVLYPDGSAAVSTGVLMQSDGQGGLIPCYVFQVKDLQGNVMFQTAVRPANVLEPSGFKSVGMEATNAEVATTPNSVYAWRPNSSDGLLVSNTSAELTSATGYVRLQGSSGGVRINHGTTASAANAYLNPSTGEVLRSTSSRRYKRDIEDADLDPETLLQLRPRQFRSRAQVDELGDEAPMHVGFIAEEAADLGLHLFVTSDEEGPEAFEYATYVAGLQAVVRHQAAQVAALTARVVALEEGTTA